MKNKKILIVISLIVLIVVGIVGYQKQFERQQINILKQEATKLNKLNFETDEIDMEIKTKGKYAVIEQEMKNYLSETRTTCLELVNLCNNSDLDKLLSADNIESDGPDFVKTREKLTTFRTQVNEYIEKCNNLMNEENIKNALNDKNLGSKYEDLYRELMIDESSKESLNKTRENFNKAAEKMNTSLNKMERILNFLTENKNEWELSNGKIQFKNISKLTEYYKVINE